MEDKALRGSGSRWDRSVTGPLSIESGGQEGTSRCLGLVACREPSGAYLGRVTSTMAPAAQGQRHAYEGTRLKTEGACMGTEDGSVTPLQRGWHCWLVKLGLKDTRLHLLRGLSRGKRDVGFRQVIRGKHKAERGGSYSAIPGLRNRIRCLLNSCCWPGTAPETGKW